MTATTSLAAQAVAAGPSARAFIVLEKLAGQPWGTPRPVVEIADRILAGRPVRVALVREDEATTVGETAHRDQDIFCLPGLPHQVIEVLLVILVDDQLHSRGRHPH